VARTRLIQNLPAKVYWDGWESDTRTLASRGWSVSMEQDDFQRRIQMAIRHEASGIQGLSAPVTIDRRRDPFDSYMQRWEAPFHFNMQALGRPVYVRGPGLSLAFGNFSPVDARTPVFVEEEEVRSLEDLVYFTPIKAKRILLPQEEVSELMERILTVQQPMREEYFREQTKNARAAAQLQAQIYSMAG
jgi:hypothetical protein